MLAGSLYYGPHALTALIGFAAVLANICVLKQISLFGLEVTASDAYTVVCVLGVNLLQEYVDREAARKAIWISFGLLGVYLVVSQIHNLFLPSPHDVMHQHYQVLFGFAPRIVTASFTAYFVSQRINYHLYGVLKEMMGNEQVLMRNLISLSSSQFLDTVLFGFLALYGVVHSLTQVIMFSFMVKMLVVLAATPFIEFCRQIGIKKNIRLMR